MNPNQNTRRLAEIRKRQARHQTQTLRTIVAETREDVKWLKRGLQTLLDHLNLDRSHPFELRRARSRLKDTTSPHVEDDRRERTMDAAGSNAVPDMSGAAFQHALDYGLPAPLEVYRRAYATLGLPWPGDEHARQLHRINDEIPPTRSSVRQLRWRRTASQDRPPASRTDTQRAASDRGGGDEPPALQRLADALGWDHTPELSEAEQNECDLELQAALVQARRFYQQETNEFERGWDTALELAVEVVGGARDGDQAQQWLRRVRHTHANAEDEPLPDQHPAPVATSTSQKEELVLG